jgi:outer membrane PBP1 activator LpoA protein
LIDTILKLHTLKLFLLLCITVLSACDTQPTKSSDTAIEEPRTPTDRQATLTEEAENLVELAIDSESIEEEFSYRARAGKLFVDAGEIKRAKEQLNLINSQFIEDKTPTDYTTASILILSADIAIAEKNILSANELIAQIKPASSHQEIDLQELKANYEYLLGDYMAAVDRRVKLDLSLKDENSKNRNSQKIWAILSSMPNAQLATQHSKNPVTSGWLDLARLMRSSQQNITQLENNLLDWGTDNQTHPISNTFLIELIDNYQVSVTNKHIAVLLPMQGDLSKVTATIKNGLLSAYYNDLSTSEKPIISFYDTSDGALTFQQLYDKALINGATNIIGPINKITISQLAQQSEFDVPILTLNYSENTLNQTDNLFQFGLSPEDEAKQVAELAIKQNKTRAAVFYPDNEWGERLSHAFTKHYESLGGEVLVTKDYVNNTNDYRRPIRTLLNLDKSDTRRTRVENIIGERVQSEPHRRQDIDMIFLAATPRSARGIMPAFKFHHAGNIPVFSTSHVYSGKVSRELDRDLNGLIFCDLPWVLQNTSSLSKSFKQNWPQQQNHTRLFALGIDAYHLIYNLDYLANSDYAFYDGQTGNIQLDSSNRITRKSLWAKFKKGRAVYFDPVSDNIPPSKTENKI